jgi:UDP-N-acetylmuramyl pentapeptide phosphotransferase/UDP-N-acetylglucosamine-1-phosphate transferase
MSKDLARLFAAPFLDAFHRVSGSLASLAAAFLLLLVGMVAARLTRAVIETVLGRIRLDEHTGRAGLNELCARLGVGKSPSAVAGFVLYWFILVVFIVSAANALNMTAVSDLLERFAQFLPSLVAAVLILFGGLMFGRLTAHVLTSAAAANSIRGGGAAAFGAYVVVVGYSAMAALEQLGARPQLVLSAAQILLGTLGLALAIAFGLGAKDLAAEWLREVTRRKS